MNNLKLVGMDAEDLEVISSHIQDAILFVRDIDYSTQSHQLNLAINRPHNESYDGTNRVTRSHAGLVFSHIDKMQVQNINKGNAEQILSLLNIEFNMREEPAGTVQLNFADNVTIKLDVNCLEVHLADIGEEWVSDVKSNHNL
ncbi:MAG: DUF2948 family protein [Rhizobiales bacterium]|nr:DUF2948 family protein [Hyphomicrobiales bacterium]